MHAPIQKLATLICANHDREVVLAAVKQNGDALVYASVALKADPLLKSWAVLTSGACGWRKVRETCKTKRIMEFWMEATAKRLYKDSPPLDLPCMTVDEPAAKRAWVEKE